jgi:formate dehydrogenase major subunit
MFCEVSPELAALKGLSNGGWATIRSARGEIEARVLVTERIRPLRLKRRTIHQIGLPYHWGSRGLSTGDATNELISFVADPNVSIQESKALTADIEPGRRSRGRRQVTTPGGPDRIDQHLRDLPSARKRPISSPPAHHGVKAAESQEGEQT